VENPSKSGGEHCEINSDFPKKVRRWCDLIDVYAHQHQLPPDLLAALIWQESGGNPKAYSRSGAVGLMQVMPRDGIAAKFECVNGPCFAERPTIAQLKDPEFNIAYGARMLANLAKRHGTLRDALKAYGPMDVGYYYSDKVLGIYKKFGG
jgi:soluble lytic murein transglycosylase-like protein